MDFESVSLTGWLEDSLETVDFLSISDRFGTFSALSGEELSKGSTFLVRIFVKSFEFFELSEIILVSAG